MIYHFEEFELDARHYELRWRDEVRPLPRKSFDLLCYLLRNAGRVVSKEEIFERIWPAITVCENVLPVTVRTIRCALGDEGRELLCTVRGRGYVMHCKVHRQAVDGVDWALDAEAAPPIFVGRRTLMQNLRARFGRAAAGDGGGVLLVGEAGVGKTRILQEFQRWVRLHTPFVFCVSSRRVPGARTFWALMQRMSRVEATVQHGVRIGPYAWRTIDPNRAHACGGRRLDPRSTQDCSPDEVRFRFARRLARLLREIAVRHPVVILLDDLHGADEDALRVIHVLVEASLRERMLVVAAYRAAEVRRGVASCLIGTIGQAPNVERIRIGGLREEAVSDLVRLEVGIEPSRALVRDLYEKTAGNALLLRELIRWMPPDGNRAQATDLPRFELSAVARSVVLHQLNGLSAECRELMAWAAVAGRAFTVPLLEQVSGLPSPSLLQRLGEAETAGVISSRDPSGLRRPLGELAFGHDLVREVIYHEIPASERPWRHQRVGRTLERMSGVTCGDRLNELAYHFVRAAPTGEIDEAVRYCAQAAQRALDQQAYEDAIQHLRNRLETEERRAQRDDAGYCEALLALGAALTRTGRSNESELILELAASLASQSPLVRDLLRR